MKKGILLGLLALSLTACSTAESIDSSSSSVSSQDGYVAAIRSENTAMAYQMSDAELIAMGYEACDAFDNGMTAYKAMDYMEARYGNDDDIMTFVASQLAASVAFLCPENSYVFNN